jgi:hypothetical protein
MESRKASIKSRSSSRHRKKDGSAAKLADKEAHPKADPDKVVRYGDGQDRFDLVVKKGNKNGTGGKRLALKKSNSLSMRLEIHLDGPFGAPASNIFRAEHAVLVATGIGVTPFSSILQSLMYRYRSAKRDCPRCHLRWLGDIREAMLSLRKVDFFWINRDQKSFEWFLKLLGEMEAEQQEEESANVDNPTMGRFLDIHLYFTAALARTDMRAVGMHLAMDLLQKKVLRRILKTEKKVLRP